MTNNNQYSCLCCGYKTLDAQPPGTYQICPICFWEDDADIISSGDNWGRSNQVSLRQAQRNFIEFGYCEQPWESDVRPPANEDMRDANWQTIDDLAEQTKIALMEKIANVFQDVTLGKGISLHQARAIDDYQDEQQARQIDGHIRWQDITDEWIEEFHDVFTIMDAKGIRHAMPAYLLWCLKYNRSDTNSFQSTVNYLKSYPSSNHFDLLNEAQKQVIIEFLQYWKKFY